MTVDYEKPLQGDYLPATLTSKDYPNLIAEGEKVDTIAVPAVLAAYNWAPNTDRYRKLTQFVDAFFTKFPTFQNPPFHPKWKEVSLSAPLPGWQRFPYAAAMARQPRHRACGAQPVRRLPEAERGDGGNCPPTPTRKRCSSNSRPGKPSRRPGPGSAAADDSDQASSARSGPGSKSHPGCSRLPHVVDYRCRSLSATRSLASARRGAAARCSGVMWVATMRIAVASTAASSVKPSTGSMSGMKSKGRMK